jgi:hypothetical protein
MKCFLSNVLGIFLTCLTITNFILFLYFLPESQALYNLAGTIGGGLATWQHAGRHVRHFGA